MAKKKGQNSIGKKSALRQPEIQDFYQNVLCGEFCHGYGLLGDRPADCWGIAVGQGAGWIVQDTSPVAFQGQGGEGPPFVHERGRWLQLNLGQTRVTIDLQQDALEGICFFRMSGK